MSHHLTSVEHIDEAMHDCITNCSDCHDVCTATLQHCLQQGGEYASAELIRALLDCVKTCGVSRDLMLRASPLHQLYRRGGRTPAAVAPARARSSPMTRSCVNAPKRASAAWRPVERWAALPALRASSGDALTRFSYHLLTYPPGVLG